MNRRAFLSHAAHSAALVSATALSAGKILGANDRVRVALIGCGGRGTHVAKLMAQVQGVEFVGACDVYDENATKALGWMGCRGPRRATLVAIVVPVTGERQVLGVIGAEDRSGAGA